MLSFIPCLSGLNYEEKLTATGLKSLKYRRERADMITIFRWINGKDRVDVSSLFDFYGEAERTTCIADYQWNIRPKRGRTEKGSNLFTNRVASKWNMLPVNVKAAPSQSIFVNRYDTHHEQLRQL